MQSMINSIFELMDMEADQETGFWLGQHGKVVKREQRAYHDVTIFEDGYEDYDYIGD